MKFIPGDRVVVLRVTEDNIHDQIEVGDIGEVGYGGADDGTYFANFPERQGGGWFTEDNVILCNPLPEFNREHMRHAFLIGESVGEARARKRFKEELINPPKYNAALFEDHTYDNYKGDPLWDEMTRS